MPKLLLGFIGSLFVYYLLIFILLTHYQYTYLNVLNGKMINASEKFENDYWGGSLKELVNKSNFDFSKTIKLSTCGAAAEIIKFYLKKNGNHNFKFVSAKDAEYIIMTNRVTWNNKFITCFNNFPGTAIHKVERNGLTLSEIRKINN